eukprot:GILJ01010920.1.p1 GENE.GILJ01010920.1~~GILJ01010920.1.p1  ORF type:complete len:640 (-),score=103.27 GILJ01010920.1:73-1839(-)
MDAMDKQFKIAEEKLVVFVVSTTGNGDYPENASRFMRWVRRKTHPTDMLTGLNYAILGLGDTNYSKYQQVPRQLDAALEHCGAKKFMKRGEADDAVGLAQFVEPWKEELWSALEPFLRQQPLEQPQPLLAEEPSAQGKGDKGEEGRETQQTQHLQEGEGEEAQEEDKKDSSLKDLTAILTGATYLTGIQAEKQVLHLELSFPRPVPYKPGDSISIKPENDVAEVDAFLELFNSTGTEQVSSEHNTAIVTPCSLREALTKYLDIMESARTHLLAYLSEHCTDAQDTQRLKHLSSSAGRFEYETAVQKRTPLRETLLAYPSARPPLLRLVEHLSPLKSRLYSISSSPLVDPSKLSIAFSVVDFPVRMAAGKTVRRKGVCTNWLQRLCKHLTDRCNAETCITAVSLLVSIERSDFTLPQDLTRPMILVGPGSGIAPFLSFLQHIRCLRSSGNQVGRITVFFGCRRSEGLESDYIYSDDLRNLVQDGTIHELFTAFSQDAEDEAGAGMWRGVRLNVAYVQDYILEKGASICESIDADGGSVFVCGDGKSMAHDVQDALISVLTKHSKRTREEAVAYLSVLQETGRYKREIWS